MASMARFGEASEDCWARIAVAQMRNNDMSVNVLNKTRMGAPDSRTCHGCRSGSRVYRLFSGLSSNGGTVPVSCQLLLFTLFNTRRFDHRINGRSIGSLTLRQQKSHNKNFPCISRFI